MVPHRRPSAGRDGCRVPLPWTAGIDGLGFSRRRPWLPQPDSFDAYARNRQEEEPGSTLRLYVERSRSVGRCRWPPVSSAG